MDGFSINYIKTLKGVLDAFPHEEFDRMIELMMDAYHNKRKIFVFGNGGSASTASHFACDINKGCSFGHEKRFRIIPLTDNIPTMLAYANDVSYDDIFVEQLKGLYDPGDIAIGISGSGNSENVIRAMKYAKDKGAKTVGLSGYSGGRLKDISDIKVHIPIDDMQKVEDLHMVVAHIAMQKISHLLNSSAV